LPPRPNDLSAVIYIKLDKIHKDSKSYFRLE
jgi:hypothetical protein